MLILYPLTNVKATINQDSIKSTKTKEIPIEFLHSEDFSMVMDEYQVEAEEFNGSEFLEGLNTFNQSGVNIYHGSDLIPGFTDSIPDSLNLSYLIVNITKSYIYSDHDTSYFGEVPGEIYFKIWVNGNYSRYPESGEISANDGDTLTLDVICFSGWVWNITVIIEVWEADLGLDDKLGKIVYTTQNLENSIIDFQTDLGDANVTVQFNITDSKTTITAEELLWGYQPYLCIDDETSGTEEPNGIYGRVCISHDTDMDKILWALQYFFFWEKETYGFGPLEVQLHKYDYEELLIFLDPTDITKPVRIVFDQALNPLYPEHQYVIYEKNPIASGSFNQTMSFAESFHPFLGTNLTVNYTVYDLNSLNTDLIPSQIGSKTLKLTIDTFYHAFDNGEGSNEISYHYVVQELSNSLLKDWYSHLNESLSGTIITIPLISNYTTPEISPFTFYVSDPFQRPYLINAWSNVMDDLDSFADAQSADISIAANLNVTMTMSIEGLITIEYPETVLPGDSYTLNYAIEMYDDKLTLRTDYYLGLNVSTNFWFLGGAFTIFQNGSFSVDVPLTTLNSLLDTLGISPQDFEDRIVDKINQYLPIDYVEVEYLSFSPQLLGTVLNASTRLHLWDLAKDFIPPIVSSLAPQIYPSIKVLFKILDTIIFHIDLQALFILQTTISGDLFLPDPTQAQLSHYSIEFNGSQAKVPLTMTVAETQTAPEIQVTLDNLTNGMNFFIDWYFDVGLEQPFSYFINDFQLYIGRYPSYEMVLPEGLIVANVSSINIDIGISSVSEFSVSKILVLNFSMIIMLVLIWRRKKKSYFNSDVPQ